MFFPWSRPVSARRLSKQVDRARRRGIGVYQQDWTRVAGAGALAPPVLEWCRDTLGHTRRPWGIARFDLALAVHDAASGAKRTLSLPNLTPTDLYPGESLLDRLTRFLDGTHDGPAPAVSHVAVALFSWGDATDAVLAAEVQAVR